MSNIQEIKKHLGHGDYTRIGRIVGVTRKYARVLLERPNAALHKEVLKAAKKVADFNQKHA
ncbi:hypothetical protein [Spirosoma aerolatum]|uniref:hypothetical protein n=1 Tax=Spirosoma aerolatum TaxID=1211326 RepID=UPI0009AE6E1B|nr:hypothetical protein [Spirosoma aerolatum]